MSIQNKLFNEMNYEYNITETKINDIQTLKWNHELGIGFLNPDPNQKDIYDKSYWDSYRALIGTEIGKNLTQARIDIANKFNIKPLHILDVGVGNAEFVDKFNCYGFDINPFAVEYLKSNKKYYNILEDSYVWEWISQWDVIEHLVDANDVLSKCNNIILSTPIYNNLEHCLSSKHLKPKEHFWYFTVSGLIHYMYNFGFDCKYYSTIESKLGRQNIGSFAFRRFKQ